jgi:phosphoglycerate dehydrogenase-like enzyme
MIEPKSVMNMKTTRVKAALFGDIGPASETIDMVYGAARLAHLRRVTDLYPTQITSRNITEHLPELHNVQVIFSTWGMFEPSAAQLDQLPHLRAVFYAAGSIKHFAIPLLERGVTVVSAAPANAVPVAEFTLAQILLADKGYFRNVQEYRAAPEYSSAFRGRGNYGATISLLGAGAIGREVIELLRPFKLRVLVFDPFLSQKGAESLGVERVETLEEAFACGDVVSNHLADVPTTKGILRSEHFALLPDNATFINTGRGQTVRHDEMIGVLRIRPDVTALLDVTDPEPLPLDHPLRELPNVHVSGHIAGSIGDEVGRLPDLVLEEFERWLAGEPLQHEVSSLMLETMT